MAPEPSLRRQTPYRVATGGPGATICCSRLWRAGRGAEHPQKVQGA